jgi:hypothetical protein
MVLRFRRPFSSEIAVNPPTLWLYQVAMHKAQKSDWRPPRWVLVLGISNQLPILSEFGAVYGSGAVPFITRSAGFTGFARSDIRSWTDLQALLSQFTLTLDPSSLWKPYH